MPDDTPVVEPTPTPEVAPETPAPEASFKPIESQDELNRILAENKRNLRTELEETKAKLAEVLPKAQRLDEIEEQNKTELQKANERAEAAEAKLLEADAREKAAAREKVAQKVALAVAKELGKDTSAALDAVGLLQGDDEESLAASARERFPILKDAATAPLPQAVHDVQPDEKDAFRAGMKQAMQ